MGCFAHGLDSNGSIREETAAERDRNLARAVDDHYKVGAFVVSLPFEEIVRVEVFAVHPDEKPEDVPQITGFRGHPEQLDHKYAEPKPAKPGW